MRHVDNEKLETTNDGINRTTKSRKNQKLGEMETYKYLEILEADIIKQVETKEKFKKSISGEGENYLKRNYRAGTS